MRTVLTCITQEHDGRLLLLATLICTIGVYGSFSVAGHAGRTDGRARILWAATSIVASGCTAWATHMVGLLAFRPGMEFAFEPVLTALSLVVAILGIGIGMVLAIGTRNRPRRFLAGVILGTGITALHYLGQAAYLVTGEVTWDLTLVGLSVPASLAIYGAATVVAGDRNRRVRRLGAPLLILAIAVLHFCGMAASEITFDPTVAFPANAVPAHVIAPVVAGICFGLLTLAVFGFRMTLAARARLRRDRERLRHFANLAVEGLAVCKGELIATANSSLERISGLSAAELTDRRISSLLPGLDVSALPEREERDAELVGADGQLVPVRVLRNDVPLGRGLQTVLAIRDQRERLRTETKIRTLAFSDTLTGLPNRARLADVLALQAATLRENGRGFAILLVDLDRFKHVNDTLGHATGDALLRKAADRLRAAAGEHDVVARIGGDEFAVVRPDPGSTGSVAVLASTIVDLLSRPFLVDGQLANVGASIGMAVAPEDGHEPEQLMRNADLALYEAKADGRGVFRRFDPALDARVQARRTLEADMRRALAVGEFEVHYQPLVDARTGVVTSAEALVRWRHAERGLVSPAEFIPLAEETGLVGPLGSWVLRTACTHAARWPSGIRVAVNLSPVQFRDPQLAEIVRAALASSGLAPARLELEITEGVMLSDEERTLATLNKLRAQGATIAMDDFGTGYSSLSYLRRFPFDKIKIDRSFVRQLPEDPESAAIVRAIATMGSCLGMTTTVEGVETAEQFAFAAEAGCAHVQGFFISRPLPLADFLSFVDQRMAA